MKRGAFLEGDSNRAVALGNFRDWRSGGGREFLLLPDLITSEFFEKQRNHFSRVGNTKRGAMIRELHLDGSYPTGHQTRSLAVPELTVANGPAPGLFGLRGAPK